MPNLSLIETEAQRLIGRVPETHRRVLQTSLTKLCEAHWHELRGQQPDSTLAQALWQVTPPLADLFIDLYDGDDGRLRDVLQGLTPAQGLALLVLAEIETGNEPGVHIAHEPMMVFEAVAPPVAWRRRIAASLQGILEIPMPHHHGTHPPLWRALFVIVGHIRRFDLPAVLVVIRMLATPINQSVVTQDNDLESLRDDVFAAGIRFVGIENDYIYLEQHGHQHKPVRTRQLGEMLLEIRQQCLR
jgi:hypothetical protein